MSGNALLLMQHDVERAVEDEVARWYHSDYIRRLLRDVPGALAVQRYRAARPDDAQPAYLALYELSDVSVAELAIHPPERPVRPVKQGRGQLVRGPLQKVTRGIYQRVLTCPEPEPEPVYLAAAHYVRQVSVDVEPEFADELEAWYDTEHLPLLAQAETVVRARRFRLHKPTADSAAELATYLALYDMLTPDPTSTPRWQAGVSTPWTQRVLGLLTRRQVYTWERVDPA